jgi:hypothetical protein
MVDSFWSFVRERLEVEREDPETWSRVLPSRVRRLRDRDGFAAMASLRVRALLDALLGAGAWREPDHWGQLLFLRATWQGRWNVPHQSWHFDFPPALSGDLPGVQLFAFLDRVLPRGGGTQVIAGSHRLVARLRAEGGLLRSRDARKRLRHEVPWLRDLFSPGPGDDPALREERFMRSSGEVDGIELRVVELAGEPGEVIAMHPFVLHAGTSNHTERARLVLTERIRARSA